MYTKWSSEPLITYWPSWLKYNNQWIISTESEKWGAKDFSCAVLGFGEVFLVCNLPESSPPHSIAARKKKTPGTQGTKSDEWNQSTREKRWGISFLFLAPLFKPVRSKPNRNCDLLARVFPALFAYCMCSWLLIGSWRCVRHLWLVRIIPRLHHAFFPRF